MTTDALDEVISQLRLVAGPDLSTFASVCTEQANRYTDERPGVHSILRWLAFAAYAEKDRQSLFAGITDDDLDFARKLALLSRGTAEWVEEEGIEPFYATVEPSEWPERIRDVWSALTGAISDEQKLRRRQPSEGIAEIEDDEEDKDTPTP